MSIRLEQVSKLYAGRPAVGDVTVDIADGEFFVLLGPSGSGKSTLLRAIAGLTRVDRGRIELHGRDVTNVNARDREAGFVFQSYALFQHMTVADNIEFALRARRVPSAKRKVRRQQLLELVALQELEHRYPRQLSGGQQQRVAVARALAHEPRVLLLDEPFGALDARIRDDLRRAIREIQRTIGITAILVTHDQDEAFSMADRIGVMDRGRLQEVGEPRQLYRHPSTRFVATFLGAANLVLGTSGPGTLRLGESMQQFNGYVSGVRAGDEVTVVVRPEDVEVASHRQNLGTAPVSVAEVGSLQFAGSVERIKLTAPASEWIANARNPGAPTFTIEVARTAAEMETTPLSPGQRVFIGFRKFHVLPTPVSSLRLLASDDAEATRLAQAPLVQELAARMQVEPLRQRRTNDEAPLRGLTIVRLDGPRDLPRIIELLARGAHQVLALPPESSDVERMAIVTEPALPARHAALAVAASMARHLTVDATILLRREERGQRSAPYRHLLDLRDISLRQHGLDIRTRSFSGSVVDALVDSPGATMDHALLVIGLNTPRTDGRLLRDLEACLTRGLPAALLLVAARPPRQFARPAPAEFDAVSAG